MTLIDRYVGEVVRRVPANEREDIRRELRSTLEELLPAGYAEKEERELLLQFGDPAVLAGKYRSQPRYLIGPAFFDLYIKLLKIIIPVVLTAVLVVLIVTTIFSSAGEASVASVIGGLIADSIAAVIDTIVNVFFWVTIVFVIIEWVDRLNRSSGKPPIVLPEKGWSPDDLASEQELMPKNRVIPRSEPAFDLIWTAVWVSVYFNADKLVGIYEGSASGLDFTTPAFDQSVLLSYWPLVVFVVILQVLMDLWKWMRRRWDLRLATLNLIVQTLTVLVFLLLFTNPDIFTSGFLAQLARIFGSAEALNWIVGGLVFTVALFAVIDVIQGFRKALAREYSVMKGWKIGKG